MVDVRFKLHSPSKIAFDMNTGSFDKKIKTCFVLIIFYKCLIQIYKVKSADLKTLFKKHAKMVVTTLPFVNSLF